MDLSCNFIAEKNLIELKIHGEYRPKSSGELLQIIYNKISQYSFKNLLFDFRNAEVFFNTLTVYDRPKIFSKVGFKRNCKYAYVFNELNEETHFLETVMRNNGFNFSVFKDYDLAIQWLTPMNGDNISNTA